MIKSSESFTYAGQSSLDFGILNVNVESSMLDEHFLPTNEIKEIVVSGRNKPYFQEVVSQPLEFELTLVFKDAFDRTKLRNLAKWLYQDYYQPLELSEDLGKIYYCIPVEDSRILHNGLNQGYVTIKMRCDNSFAYSSVVTSSVYSSTGNLVIEFSNDGDLKIKPEIWVTQKGATDISIVNVTDGNKEFKFTGLALNEQVYVDNENEYILTDLPLTYRYDAFNNGFMEMLVGNNELQVTGIADIQFRYRLKYLY